MAKSVILKNTTLAFLGNAVTIAVNFVVQRMFVDALGIEYVGVNSVLNSIVAILAMADLGLSGAIIFHLYKPLHDREYSKAMGWLKFYRRANHIIALLMVVIACILTFFVPVFVSGNIISENVYVVFWLLVASMLFNYLLSYKKALLQADQKSYIISAVHIIYTLAVGAGQILILTLSGSFYLFLGIVVILRLVENIILNRIIAKKYGSLLKSSDNSTLTTNERKDVSKRMRASVFHSVAGYIVNGTDNLILSQVVSVFFVGLFANYYMVINAIHVVVMQVFSANTATIGHRLVEKDYKGSLILVKRLMFANSWLATWLAISLYCVISPFVQLWLGPDYVIGDSVILVLCISFYLTLVRLGVSSVKTAGGVVYEDRFVPIVEAILNLILSIVLGIAWGAIGVFLGTILSTLLLHLYSYPKYVFKLILRTSPTLYLKLFIRYAAVFVGALLFAFCIKRVIPPMGALTEFILLGFICLIVSALIWWIIFAKTEEMRFFLGKARRFLKATKKRSK